MTTAIAATNGTTAWIAADSRTNVGGANHDDLNKIFKKRDFLIAAAGSGSLLSIIKLNDFPAIADFATTDEWADEMAEQLTQLCIDKEITDEGEIDGSFLIATPKQVYFICKRMAIKMRLGIIGSGSELAIGAWEGSERLELETPDRMRLALNVAKKFDRHTGGRIRIKSIG